MLYPNYVGEVVGGVLRFADHIDFGDLFCFLDVLRGFARLRVVNVKMHRTMASWGVGRGEVEVWRMLRQDAETRISAQCWTGLVWEDCDVRMPDSDVDNYDDPEYDRWPSHPGEGDSDEDGDGFFVWPDNGTHAD